MFKWNQFEKISNDEWLIQPKSVFDVSMRVPAVIYASESLLMGMDDKAINQLCNVASLPGIVGRAYAMPDAHWGYGFPIGGVAAFDPQEGGVISAGGVGFDISCGVRLLTTGIHRSELETCKRDLANALFMKIPSGVGSQSRIRLDHLDLDEMLLNGALWAVQRGYGNSDDLVRIEERGRVEGALPDAVSDQAKKRQFPEMGTLGSGNHYFEIQVVSEIHDSQAADVFGLKKDEVVISIHCGSRGLGHQIGTDYLRKMVVEAPRYGIQLPDRELACVPILSELGVQYLGAMRAGINCALANRQILTHFAREVFSKFFPSHFLKVMYDVSHNTCKEESHMIQGRPQKVFVHRKGATRAYGPGHQELPDIYQHVGQPVIVGGSMGTGSYVLVGTETSELKSFSSSCHGSGRAISRTQALKNWSGRKIMDDLEKEGVLVRSASLRGIAEEAPGAYKDVTEVVNSAERSGLSKKVAFLKPLICVKG